ncbi:MAG: hypothetical protein VZR00_07850 [Lachnospiraceae bacterium]|jgi:cytoskeletal protein RodZ|nr:hypothetical protein [Lachnospiraceae bacterium]MEE3461780.1 hypothetical protein [Lachnospiraceae bacterium]
MDTQENKKKISNDASKKHKKKRKKMTASGVISTLILVIVFAILCWMLVLAIQHIYETHKADRQQKELNTTPVESPLPEGVTEYSTVIGTSDEHNDTSFRLTFDSNSMTYKEVVFAGSQKSELDKGTYTEDGGHITAVSDKSKKEYKYAKDGDYLVSLDNMYEGTVPEGKDRFSAEFILRPSENYMVKLEFMENGTYKSTSTGKVKPEGSDKAEEQSFVKSGKYEIDGNFIKRDSTTGETLLPLYIYNGQITDGYYKKVSG